MELSILNIKGEDTGRKVSLNDTIFGIEPNDHAIYLDVKQYLANQRQGTHSSKGRSQLSGSTRKLGKQKGSGGARPGDIKSGVRVGGGRMFGPHPRDYHFKLNKKVKQLARRSALSYKAKENNILVIEDFNIDTVGTKQYLSILKGLNITDNKNLVLLGAHNENIYLSSRNVQRNQVLLANDVNTYAILNAQKLVVTESALKALSEVLAK